MKNVLERENIAFHFALALKKVRPHLVICGRLLFICLIHYLHIYLKPKVFAEGSLNERRTAKVTFKKLSFSQLIHITMENPYIHDFRIVGRKFNRQLAGLNEKLFPMTLQRHHKIVAQEHAYIHILSRESG